MGIKNTENHGGIGRIFISCVFDLEISVTILEINLSRANLISNPLGNIGRQ